MQRCHSLRKQMWNRDMETELASWMKKTAGLPLAFAQVREDALQDRWIVDSLPAGARVLMIASGGCTAALLATRPNVAQLHLVDANPAQLALAQLKLRLLTLPGQQRLAILGHTEMDASDRAAAITRLLDNCSCPPPFLVRSILWLRKVPITWDGMSCCLSGCARRWEIIFPNCTRRCL